VPKGTEDAARQIGEFLFFHLWPENAVYIRHTVRQDLWREAVGTPFPKHETLAQSYTDEMWFMYAVRQAFEVRGLAARRSGHWCMVQHFVGSSVGQRTKPPFAE
jgi:hypothetical protein